MVKYLVIENEYFASMKLIKLVAAVRSDYKPAFCVESVEDAVELLRTNHTSTTGSDGAHLKIDTNGDGSADYEVYYVPANNQPGVLTTLPLPTNFAYTVSGDNIGGFIVTVDLNTPTAAA